MLRLVRHVNVFFFSNVDENVALHMASALTVEPAVIDTDLEPVVRNVAPAQAVICTAAAAVIEWLRPSLVRPAEIMILWSRMWSQQWLWST